jgi:hypothetical protein
MFCASIEVQGTQRRFSTMANNVIRLKAREDEALFNEGLAAAAVLKDAGLQFEIADDARGKNFAKCSRALAIAALGIEPRMVASLADAGVTLSVKIGLAGEGA